MEKDNRDTYKRMFERYASGDIPWDDELPPPEVIDLISNLPAGRALDLGCGYGRTTIYLARRGWEVDGIDFIPMAIEIASKRSKSAGVDVRLHLASVVDLHWLASGYDLAIDIGCAHNLGEKDLQKYRDHLSRLIRPGGYYLLFARVSNGFEGDAESPPSYDMDVLRVQFQCAFDLVNLRLGKTDVPGQPIWPSAWFLFRKN